MVLRTYDISNRQKAVTKFYELVKASAGINKTVQNGQSKEALPFAQRRTKVQGLCILQKFLDQESSNRKEIYRNERFI